MFVGIISSIAADAGYLVLIPLAAAAFISVGRHPLAGLAAAFAAVASAFLVNVLIVPVDGILTEITNDAIRLVNPNRSIDLAANVWFSIGSVALLTILISVITERVIEPRLGPYTGDYQVPGETGLSEDEYRGLRYALFGLLGVIAFLALLTLPPGAPLRNPETGAIIGASPFMNSLIVSIALIFLVCGTAYGIGARTMSGSNDVIGAMQKAIGGLAGLILLLLVISQFIAYFNYTNMATLAAVSLARILQQMNLDALWLLLGFVVVVFVLDLIITAAIAKWAIFAPIFVPLLMQLGRRAGGRPGRLPCRRQSDELDHAAQRLFRDDRDLRDQVSEGCRCRNRDRADAALCAGHLGDLDGVPRGMAPARAALGTLDAWRSTAIHCCPGLWRPAMGRAARLMRGHARPSCAGQSQWSLGLTSRLRIASLAVLAALVVAAPVTAQPRNRADPNPDASIEIEQVRVGVLAVGASVGGGRLHFRGEEHRFTVRGIETGSVGVSSLSARGEVFGLRRLQDFAGRYSEQVAPRNREGAAGPETRWLRNAAGVEIRLRTERSGGQFRFNDAGVTIELR